MIASKKNLRYFYWLAGAFVKKNLRLILISFIVSLIIVVSAVSLMPYLANLVINRKTVIGLVGNYDYSNPPSEVAGKISSGLVFVNDLGEITPALASSWEERENGKVFRIHLKENLYWNSGRPFTAHDVNFSFKDVSVKVVDDHLIEFRLQKPLAIFPTYLTEPIIRFPLDGVAGLYKTGQVKVKSGQLKEIYLTANKPNYPDIVYKIYDNDSQVIDAYKLADIRSFTTSKKNVADLFAHWPNTRITKGVDYTLLLTLFFNLNNDYLKDKDVRQAIAQAIDRQILSNFGIEAQSSIPPISWAYNPNLKKNVFDHDYAKKILDKNQEASPTAKLNFVTFYEYLDSANLINKYLNEAGLPTNLDLSSFNGQNNFDLLLAYFKVHYDPDQYFFWHSTQAKGGNITAYNNKKIDKLLEDGRSTIDKKTRKIIYFEEQKVMQDDPPAVFLYYPFVYTVERK